MDFWLRAREIDPQDPLVPIVGESEIRFAIAIDVRHPAALGVVAVGDEMLLPHHARLARILIPPNSIADPAGGNKVRRAIVVYVDRPLSTIRDKLLVNADGAILMLLPFASLRTGILIPVGAAQDVRTPIAIHVQSSDALGVIGTQAMRNKRDLRSAARARTSSSSTFRLGSGGESGEDKNDATAKVFIHDGVKLLQLIQLDIAEKHFRAF